MAGSVCALDRGHRAPGRPLRAIEAERAEFLVGDIGPDPTVGALDPFLELGQELIEDLVAVVLPAALFGDDSAELGGDVTAAFGGDAAI